MTLKLFNTLARKKEVFTPLRAGRVGLYTCGPTVYNYAHIGNLRTYVFEDILRRVLEYNGYTVRHIMNITDVGHLTSDADTGEDKMEKGAAREHKSAWDIAKFYTEAFKEDIRALHILEPHVWCRATDHITEQIALIQTLERKGYTYATEDGVYFDTAKFPSYGALARLDVKGMKSGARVVMVEGKRSPTDFALWKFSPKNSTRQMEWSSPWGKGFPGWHIECSAMSMRHLGETFDIHTGGVDHIPVHHTNEIAQSEAATGKQFVRYWLHGEFLSTGSAKMAKSAENFLTLRTLAEKGYDPLTYRYLLLTAHYRKKLRFSWKALDAAATALEKLRSTIATMTSPQSSPARRGGRSFPLRCDCPLSSQKRDRVRSGEGKGEVTAALRNKFLSHINNDLNMPGALAYLWSIVRSRSAPDVKIAAAKEFDAIFALDLLTAVAPVTIPHAIAALAEERERARHAKNWTTADTVRKKIEQEGWIVEDTPNGPRIKRTSI